MKPYPLLAVVALGCVSPQTTDPSPNTEPAPTESPTPQTSKPAPSTSDRDEDGLTDAEELELGTDPDKPDTDADGWTDLEEVEGNTDPLLADDHPYTGGWAIGACRNDVESTGHDVGDIADDFELVDQFGDTLRLHDFCDRQVLLVSAAFW